MIKKTKPILKKTPIPDFTKMKNSGYEEKKYWEKEELKYREGVGSDVTIGYNTVKEIPGSLYFASQMGGLGTVKNRNSGQPEEYRVRDIGLLYHQQLRESMMLRKRKMDLKARGTGYTTEMAWITDWTWMLNPGSRVIMTSNNKKNTEGFYFDKIKVILENIHPRIHQFRRYDAKENPGELFKETVTGTAVEVQLRKEIKGVFHYSSLLAKQTAESDLAASTFSSGGALGCLIDEFFLNRRFNKLLNSVESVMADPNTKELNGWLACGGVCEDTVSPEDRRRLYEYWAMAKESPRWITYFTPFWMGMNTDENGWSNEEKSTIWWEAQYEELNKLEDKTSLVAFLKNNPRSEDDVWQFATSGQFEDDVQESIKYQLDFLRKNPVKRERANIILHDQTLVKSTVSTGNVIIFEEPKEGILYYGTMDATGTGSTFGKGGNEGSQASTHIIKGYEPNPEAAVKSYGIVATLNERPKTVEQSYRNACNLIRYYNRHNGFQKISAEANVSTAEHLSQFMIKEGLQKFIPFYNGKPFVYIMKSQNKDVRATQYLRANAFLRKYMGSMNYQELLENFISPEDISKKDKEASWLMLFFILPKDFDQPPKIVKKFEWEEVEIIGGVSRLVRREMDV